MKILDFGLAKLAASASGVMLHEASTTDLATASGVLMGTAGLHVSGSTPPVTMLTTAAISLCWVDPV